MATRSLRLLESVIQRGAHGFAEQPEQARQFQALVAPSRLGSLFRIVAPENATTHLPLRPFCVPLGFSRGP